MKTPIAVTIIENEHAEAVPGAFIRLHGMTKKWTTEAPHGVMVPYDITFKVGDSAEYDSYNLHYIGTIVSIGAKTVTIREKHEKRTRRLDFHTFNWRNQEGLDAKRKRNSEWSD